jgi:hypothetical protein
MMRMVICLQITSVFLIDQRITSSDMNVCGVNDVGQTEMHTAVALVPESSPFEDEIAIEH